MIRPKHWQFLQVPEHKHSRKNFSFHFVVRFTTLFARSCEEESTALYLTSLFTRSCEEESTRLVIKPKRWLSYLDLSTLVKFLLTFCASLNYTFHEIVLPLNNFHSSTTGLRTALAVHYTACGYTSDCCLLVCVFVFFQCHKSGQGMCKFNTKVDHCFCKVKISLS